LSSKMLHEFDSDRRLDNKQGKMSGNQGCQIFLGIWYQTQKKCTKLIKNVPNGLKLSQISIKYSKWP
jgi:hypothetical protein